MIAIFSRTAIRSLKSPFAFVIRVDAEDQYCHDPAPFTVESGILDIGSKQNKCHACDMGINAMIKVGYNYSSGLLEPIWGVSGQFYYYPIRTFSFSEIQAFHLTLAFFPAIHQLRGRGNAGAVASAGIPNGGGAEY
jgi:hypothetical protein